MIQFYHDTTRDLLVYPTHSAVLQQAIPEAKQVNGQYVAVPRTLRNSQVLRWLNFPVPPVMTDRTYDWPIERGRKALAHQKMMANFAVLHPKMFNLSDPGTMKTLAALWAADFLMRQHPPGAFRVLIVGPLNVLETVWAKAIFTNFLSRRSFEILHGSADKRLALLARKPDFAIINYDGVGVGAHSTPRKRIELDGFSKALLDDTAIQLVIVDEADGYIDATTKRHRIARQIFGQRKYLWMLTGSPTSQAPTDAYGLAKMVNNAFGKSFTTFRDETMFKISNFKWVPRRDGYETARKLLTPAIRFDIREVWRDAPPMTVQQRLIPLTPEQTKQLHRLKNDMQIEVRSGKVITAVNEAAARTKFLQIVLGAIYDTAHKAHAVDAEPRYAEVERLVQATPRKVLIFVPLTSIIDILYKRLSKRWRCGIINGHVSANARPDIIRAFESEDDFKLLLLDAQSTAHGINEFVVADTVIWMGPIDKTRLWVQGNKRAHRPGQNWPVTVYQLVATKLEKEMFRRLESNETMQGALLDAIRKGEL